MSTNFHISAGRILDQCNMLDNLPKILASIEKQGYKFAIVQAAHPRCCVDTDQLFNSTKQFSNGTEECDLLDHEIHGLLPQLSLPDTVLSGDEWSRKVVGRVSSWIDPDAMDPHLRRLSEKGLQDELAYFSYLSLPAVLIQLRGRSHANLARIISEHLAQHKNSSFSVWVDVPICSPMTKGTDKPLALNGHGYMDHHNDNLDQDDPWHWFYLFRRSCDNNGRINVVLQLTQNSPASALAIQRWIGEPLVAIKMHIDTFLADKQGDPYLSTAHGKIIEQLANLNLHYILDGPNVHASVNQNTKVACPYVETLTKWLKPESMPSSEMAIGYEKLFMSPMQPLGDNLGSAIYERFETDPIKYKEYKRAFREALATKINGHRSEPLVIMVLGAGRGPLVQVCYEVLTQSGVAFKLYAVEKNPCALITLNSKRVEQWKNQVEVIFSDMRDFHPERKADIIVSELLGSFGDNELSPECLDGAMHLVNDNCISIPQAYRSFISPVHSPRLMKIIQTAAESEHNLDIASEKVYGVRLFNSFEIAPAKELFKFQHPNWTRSSNERYAEVQFVARESSELLGVAGFFSMTLFGNIEFSMVPNRETIGQNTWLRPLLFRLKDPVYVAKGQQITVRFWRRVSEHHVWYEWQFVEPNLTPIMNINGRSHRMRLYKQSRVWTA